VSRIYTVPYSGTLTNAGGDSDLFEFQTGANRSIRLVGLVFAQTSDYQDAQEEGLRIAIMLVPATLTAGSGGTVVDPVPVDARDQGATFSAACNNTTVATTSETLIVVEEAAWNIRMSPLERWWPDPETRITYFTDGADVQAIVVRCMSTPADDIDIAITAYVEEL
jgi:hypothetical protein